MSEQTAETGAATEPTATPTEPAPVELGDAGKQAIDRMKAERDEARKAAKANAEAAKELATLKQSQMTEAERTVARLAEMERETALARAEALRFRTATRHGISDEDAELFLTATDQETLERQAVALAARTAAVAQTSTAAPAGPRPDLSQGARDGGLALNSDELTEKLARAVGARR